MTACILTGFAKRKKFVGTVYACNGSDLPATQDFGTVQYQGPSETALTVPATTVTYTIIGKTQCGDDIRRITTKTYSSRNGAGYKYTSAHGYGVWDILPALNLTTDQWNLISNCLPHPTDIGLHVSMVTPCPPIQMAIYSAVGSVRTTYCFTAPNYPCAGGASGCTDVIWATTSITVHYIDVHEVWTYDLV